MRLYIHRDRSEGFDQLFVVRMDGRRGFIVQELAMSEGKNALDLTGLKAVGLGCAVQPAKRSLRQVAYCKQIEITPHDNEQ